MQWGDFRDYFKGFAWKRLTAHEVDPTVSNGHEFQGIGGLRAILGDQRREQIPTKYILLSDDGTEPQYLTSWASWYDARANNSERSAEWRLYYSTAAGEIQNRMRAGDLLVIGVTQRDELILFLTRSGSEREAQLRILFGIDVDGLGPFRVRSLSEPIVLDFVTASILEQLGIAEARTPDGSDADIVADLVEELVREYGARLPSGDTVSTLIRSRLPGVNGHDDPDDALYRWIEAEAAMYRGWEDRKIANRIRDGFVDPAGAPDVSGFRQFSMAIRQSRVSRAGGALQYHFRALLELAKVPYVMEPEIDGGEVPDFLFPSKEAYEDSTFPADQLRMLAAKFTAKDRWRQVLNEAHRIKEKHLLTMEAAISANQMKLMTTATLTLVIPQQIRNRYSESARPMIMTVGEFLTEIQSPYKARNV